MGQRRPERDSVEALLKEERRMKANEVAEAVGLIETMGHDKAVSYVRQVRKSLKKNGELEPDESRFATDAERLEDIQKLFELRQGKKISRKVAGLMLLLNCYYMMRSPDYKTHHNSLPDTYEKNNSLQHPFSWDEVIAIGEQALEHYTNSNDPEKDKEAKAKGYPGSGLNYTSENLAFRLELTEEEEKYMKTIRR